jgi:iron(III) transport system ATP-binding protein
VVQQVDTPWALYNRPANRFVATFVGSNNFLPITAGPDGQARLLGHALDLAAYSVPVAAGCVASVRPERVLVDAALDAPGVQVGATVRQAMFSGRELQLTLEVAGHGPLDALTPPSAAMMALVPGAAVTLGLRTRDLLFFAPGDSGARLP